MYVLSKNVKMSSHFLFLDPEVEADPSRNPDPALDPVDPVPNPRANPSQDPSPVERVPPSQSPNHGQSLVNNTRIDLM